MAPAHGPASPSLPSRRATDWVAGVRARDERAALGPA